MSRNRNEIYEDLKEYKMYVDGLDYPIKGRIVQRTNLTSVFRW